MSSLVNVTSKDDLKNTDDNTTNIDLIVRDLAEVLDKELLVSKSKITIYWGTAPTGIPSIGYLCPLRKIVDFIHSQNVNVIVLLADLHAFLDNSKSTLEIVGNRVLAYKQIITNTLQNLGLTEQQIAQIKFVIGSDFQLNRDYQLDLLKLGNMTPINIAQKASSEVVKKSDNPLITSLLYPLMQVLDEEYLKCDATLGGIDQRKIFTLATSLLPKIGYKKKAHLMNPIISALSNIAEATNDKMSSSDTNKISLLDSPKQVQKKIAKVFCQDGNVKDNTLLTFIRDLLFPLLNGEPMIFNRPEQYGGKLAVKTSDELNKVFENKTLSSIDLKLGVCELINKFMTTIDPELIKKCEW